MKMIEYPPSRLVVSDNFGKKNKTFLEVCDPRSRLMQIFLFFVPPKISQYCQHCDASEKSEFTMVLNEMFRNEHDNSYNNKGAGNKQKFNCLMFPPHPVKVYSLLCVENKKRVDEKKVMLCVDQ